MGTAVRPAKTSPGPWDAFADVDVFVEEVLAELVAMAMEGAQPHAIRAKGAIGRSRAAQSRHGDLVCFVSVACSGGRSGLLCDMPFSLAHAMGCSPAGLGSASGAGCSTGCARTGGSPAVIPRNRAP